MLFKEQLVCSDFLLSVYLTPSDLGFFLSSSSQRASAVMSAVYSICLWTRLGSTANQRLESELGDSLDAVFIKQHVNNTVSSRLKF